MIVRATWSELLKYVGDIVFESDRDFSIGFSLVDKKGKVKESYENQAFNEALAFCFSFSISSEKKFPTTNIYSKFRRSAYYKNLVSEALRNSTVHTTTNPVPISISLIEGLEGRIVSITSPTSQFDLKKEISQLRRITKRLTLQGVGLARAINTEFPVSYESNGTITNILGRTEGIYPNGISQTAYHSPVDYVFDKFSDFLFPGD